MKRSEMRPIIDRMREMFNIDLLKKHAKTEWDEFCQNLDPSADTENECVHVLTISDGSNGRFTFVTAFEEIEGRDVGSSYSDDVEVDFVDEKILEWSECAGIAIGSEYFVDWFEADGSIAVFYKPVWDSEDVVDDFAGSWAWSKGISPDSAMSKKNVEEYLLDIKEVLYEEFLLKD